MHKAALCEIADTIIADLSTRDVLAVLWKKANTGSCYIRIPGVGSIRISDHEGRKKYRYKFNVRSDIHECYQIKDRGIVRKFYPCNAKGLRRLYYDIETHRRNFMNADTHGFPYPDRGHRK